MNVVNINDFLNEQLEIARKEREEHLRKEQKLDAIEEFNDIDRLKNKVLALKHFIEYIYPKFIEKLIVIYRNDLLNNGIDHCNIDRNFTFKELDIVDKEPYYNDAISDFLKEYHIGKFQVGRGVWIRASMKKIIDAYYTELQLLPDRLKQVEDIIEGHGYDMPMSEGSHKR